VISLIFASLYAFYALLTTATCNLLMTVLNIDAAFIIDGTK